MILVQIGMALQMVDKERMGQGQSQASKILVKKKR